MAITDQTAQGEMSKNDKHVLAPVSGAEKTNKPLSSTQIGILFI